MTETLLPTSDRQLLHDLASEQARFAYEQIVHRYVHLVHAAAYRQTRDHHLAEDVTQAVFLFLWQQRDNLKTETYLPGWLLNTARNLSLNAIKQKSRRRSREQKVAEMKPAVTTTAAADANELAEHLDEVLSKLQPVDRDAIVGRFFLSQSMEQVGQSLGIHTAAATKRVSRALDKLHTLLKRKGISADQATLTALFPMIAQQPHASTKLIATALSTSSPGASVSALLKTAASAKSAALVYGVILAVLMTAITIAIIFPHKPRAAAPVGAPVLPVAAPIAPPQLVPENQGRAVTFIMVDEKTNAPLKNASVEVTIGNDQPVTESADADGKYVLHLPPAFKYVRAVCRAEGRVPMALDFQDYTFKGDPPSSYTVPMQVATKIGGVVKGDDGQPLAGAKVRVSSFIEGDFDAPRVSLSGNVTTDANGKWEFDSAPAKLNTLYLEIKHPDYPGTETVSQSNNGQTAMTQLHTLSHEVKFHKDSGRLITGAVVDAQGNPVDHVKLVIANDRYESEKPVCISDDNGNFEFNNVKIRWQTFITATAPGFAPAQVKLLGEDNGGSKENKPIEIRLKAPAVLEGTLVDKNGKPVSNARVEAENWNENRALEWSVKTDRNGHFAWRDAPVEPFQINIYKDHYTSISQETVTAGKPISLTLYPTVNISGSVVNADTKAPIPAFRIIYGNTWTKGQDVTWQTASARKLGHGKYSAEIAEFCNGGKLKVEADGYLPAISRLIQASEGTITIDFELKKGSGPSGIVLAPDGKPEANLTVYILPGNSSMYIDLNQDMSHRSDGLTATTDKDGRYFFQPNDKPFVLITSCDDGYAILKSGELPKDGTVRLQKWAKIEGDFRMNASPAKQAVVAAAPSIGDPGRPDSISLAPIKAIADENGHFVIDHVPAGKNARLIHLVPLGAGSERYVDIGYISTTAGETATVHLGGKGRPVVGKLHVADSIATPIDFTQQLNIFPVAANDPMSRLLKKANFPENYPDLSADEQSRLSAAAIKVTPAILAELNQVGGRVDFVASSDGTIRADEVTPGTYRFNVMLRESFAKHFNPPGPAVLGNGEFTITVPPAPGPSDEAIDVGTIEVKPAAKLEFGKTLPGLDLVTTDGQPVDQSTWAGKVVVLHIWNMQSRNLFPAINAIADKYKDNSKLMIVNIGTQMMPAWVKHIAGHDPLKGISAMDQDSYDLNWQMTYNHHPEFFRYAVPNVFLVGADGNVLSRFNDGEKLKAAIDQSLSK